MAALIRWQNYLKHRVSWFYRILNMIEQFILKFTCLQRSFKDQMLWRHVPLTNDDMLGGGKWLVSCDYQYSPAAWSGDDNVNARHRTIMIQSSGHNSRLSHQWSLTVNKESWSGMFSIQHPMKLMNVWVVVEEVKSSQETVFSSAVLLSNLDTNQVCCSRIKSYSNHPEMRDNSFHNRDKVKSHQNKYW